MPASRTQADRTAATRAAVLEATVDLLIERGYAGTSTRLAAQRAGISLGALQHHFPSKASLSVAALRYVLDRVAAEFVADAPGPGPELERIAALLDRLYVVFTGPTFSASMELIVAARTDPDLRQPVRELHRHMEQLIGAAAAELLPDAARLPGFASLLDLALAAVRGLAVLAAEPGGRDQAAWEHVRTHLLTAAEHVLKEDPA